MGPVRGTGSSSILTLRTQDPSYLRRGRLAQELLRFAAKASSMLSMLLRFHVGALCRDAERVYDPQQERRTAEDSRTYQ